jgi:hypothetical protein
LYLRFERVESYFTRAYAQKDFTCAKIVILCEHAQKCSRLQVHSVHMKMKSLIHTYVQYSTEDFQYACAEDVIPKRMCKLLLRMRKSFLLKWKRSSSSMVVFCSLDRQALQCYQLHVVWRLKKDSLYREVTANIWVGKGLGNRNESCSFYPPPPGSTEC